MFLRIFFAFVLVGFCSAATNETETFAFASIEVVSDIEKYKSENPDVILTELEQYEDFYKIVYFYGYRIDGDSLVGSGADSEAWPKPTDVELIVQYPKIGTNGAVVNYVKINVLQTHNTKSAYIAEGGIGKRNIKVIVEALKVSYFKYDFKIYGKY